MDIVDIVYCYDTINIQNVDICGHVPYMTIIQFYGMNIMPKVTCWGIGMKNVTRLAFAMPAIENVSIIAESVTI